jgi:hypothetical protein
MLNPWKTRKFLVSFFDQSIYKFPCHSDLQDGMQNNWDQKVIAQILKEYVAKQKIDTVRFYGIHIYKYNG